jgi:SlyX protein
MNEQLQELRAQLVEIQTQLAFQEDTLQALDRAVAAQQRQIDQLLQLSEHMGRQVSDLSDWLEEQRESERPPHY